jgi:hypothetical protein
VQNLANWQKMQACRTAGGKRECAGLLAENVSARDCQQKCKHTEPSQLVENSSASSYLTRSLMMLECLSPLEDKDGHRGVILYKFLMPAPMGWERRARKWRQDARNRSPKPPGYNSSGTMYQMVPTEGEGRRATRVYGFRIRPIATLSRWGNSL